MAENDTLNAADELLAAAGMSTDDFADEPEGEEGKGDGKETEAPAWQTEIGKLRDEFRQGQSTNQMQVMQALSAAVGKKDAAPPKEDEISPNDQAALHKLALENPAVMQALIDRNVEKAVAAKTAKIEDQLAAKMARNGAADYLRSQVYELYGDEIKDQNSEIMRTIGTVQAKLRTMLDPSMIGTQQEAELSVLLAAALNPKAVSKRQRSRDDAFEKTRAQRLARAAAMAGLGGREQKDDGKFSDDELELFDRFGLDLTKDGPEILANRKRTRMNYMNKGQLMSQDE
jgi:hypothetical protein